MTIYRLHLVEWIFKAAKDNIILSQREGKIKKNPVTSIGFFFFFTPETCTSQTMVQIL